MIILKRVSGVSSFGETLASVSILADGARY
jgi:hypothetical protein